ncbi:MAG: hypothetical protein MJK15_20150 [Colwellia sp.]|nr:hypothetical protein [Colwellia sp.]
MINKIYKYIRSHGAAALALSAILLATWEGVENRKHNRLSVLPHVEVSKDFDMATHQFNMHVDSTGLGPAVINGFYTFFDGKLVHSDESHNIWITIKLGLMEEGLHIYSDSSVSAGEFLQPGDSKTLIKLAGQAGQFELDNFRKNISRIGMLLCYCSVYGDNCSNTQTGVISDSFIEENNLAEQCGVKSSSLF